MKKRTRLMALGLAIVLAFSLGGCSVKEALVDVLVKVLGVDESGDDESSTDIYAPAGGSIALPEGFDTEATWTTQIADGSLYLGFRGIQNKTTGYFVASGSSMTFTSYASTESTSWTEYKAALWKLSDDDATTTYVDKSTIYFTTSADESCYTYTLDGLEAGARYKVVVSFDAGSAYITGAMQVQGVTDTALEEIEGESSSGKAQG